MSTVLLFDIDGTLLLTGGAGRRAMEGALVDVRGAADALREMDFGGMTDPLIIRTALREAGRPDGSEDVARLIARYLDLLPGEVARSGAYRVLPGVVPLLEALRGREGVAVGLGTGNVERGASVKLGRGRLQPYFGFGGFGSDREDRVELLRVGLDRGAARLGVPSGRCRVVVIGDTPRDVAAARALGAECVAVATGGHGVGALRELGACAAFEDLSDGSALRALLGREPGGAGR